VLKCDNVIDRGSADNQVSGTNRSRRRIDVNPTYGHGAVAVSKETISVNYNGTVRKKSRGRKLRASLSQQANSKFWRLIYGRNQ
jgi:hypothetical protein